MTLTRDEFLCRHALATSLFNDEISYHVGERWICCHLDEELGFAESTWYRENETEAGFRVPIVDTLMRIELFAFCRTKAVLATQTSVYRIGVLVAL